LTSLLVPSTTLVNLLREQAAKSPDRTILRFVGDKDDDELCLTYAEVDRRARSIAALLQSLGASGERALVLHQPGLAYITALLGCLYAGVIAVPAYPPRFNRPMTRLREIVVDAQARFALTTSTALDRMAHHIEGEPALAALKWLATDQAEQHDASNEWQPICDDPNAIAVLQYTSGSTSTPKGVVLSHANFIYNISALAQLRDADSDDRFVSWLPPYHDMGLVGATLLPLCIGIEAILLAPSAFLQRPLRWLSTISRYAATISGGPNFAYELCVRRINEAQRETLDLRSWRVAFSGAERVRADTLSRFAKTFAACGFRDAAFAPCYGLAEATLGVSFSALDTPATVTAWDEDALSKGVALTSQPEQPSRVLVGCGRALTDCEVIVVDPETRQRKSPGGIGELWVRSPGVARGYWGKPELSEQVFHAQLADANASSSEYLRTGDLGFLQADEIFVVGRIKDLIILRGINYYPEDIESTVETSHSQLRIAAGAAFAVDDAGEERLVIVQEVDAGRDLPLQLIATSIKNAIAEAHELLVHEVVLLAPGGVPRTSSGKVQRSRCRELYLTGQLEPLLRLGAVAEQTAAPAALIDGVAQLMAELLGVDTVSVDDDFFWLGGHSLMATQLASRVRDVFGVDLPLRTIFEASTPRTLAARIASAPTAAALPRIELVDRSGKLPLSFSQERMWFMHQLDPHGAAYNVAGAVLLEGQLDVVALRKSFAQILQRHEVLRTNYLNVAGEPELHIAATASLALELHDVTNHADAEATALTQATALARTPFDIAKDLLIRAELYRIAPEKYVLSICMHHLVTDAWSVGLLVTDMLSCYDACVANAPPVLPASRIAYVDYAQWQRQYFSGERLHRELAFWKKQLAGAEAIELPTDRPRSQRRSSAGSLEPLILPAELMNSLTSLSAAQGSTLFMVMLAAFEVLLHRYTHRTDIVVGVPVANRNLLASESQMGTLVNTLALRLQFDAELNFDALLQQVREAALDAYAHQDLPFERLVSELSLERRVGESPLVSVMFDFQNAPMPGRSEGALRMRPLLLSRGAAQFDLSLLILDTEFGRVAGVEYSTDLFDAATIKRLLGHYLSILESIALHPTGAISRIPLLTSAERHELLAHAGSNGDSVDVNSVSVSFEQQVTATPHAAAVSDAQGTLTYQQLQHSVNLLSTKLSALGAGPGKRVAIYLERDRDLVIALLATLHSGATYVPLDPRHPRDRIQLVLEDSEPHVVLTKHSLRSSLSDSLSATILCLDDATASTTTGITQQFNTDESAAAYVIYTSGSTGGPKGVEVSRQALANFLHSMHHTPGINADDRLLAITTVAFDIAGLELFLPLINGACVYLAGTEIAADGLQLMRLMNEWRPTIMQATPATWKMLIEAGWKGDPQLKALCGGEALPRELADELLARSASLWNMYGPTETTIWSTLQRVQRNTGPLVPIGHAIDATNVYILDRHQELMPMGIPGEIYIGGAGVANGYFKRPDLTQERFLPDGFAAQTNARMYRTGDAGRLRSDGAFEHLGRLDSQIKLRGFRIEPGEIEVALKDNAAIRDALVIAREDHPGDVRLVAYYIPASVDASNLPLTDLVEPLRRKLPSYMIPAAFVALRAFPQTPNGKIDRRALPRPDGDANTSNGVAGEDYLAPRDELEAELVRLWEEILNSKAIGVRDNFFMLGGHSLLAVRCFARIEQRLSVVLPMATLFERPTIEYLAERIRAERALQNSKVAASKQTVLPAASRRFSYIVPIQEQGTRAPLFCVHGAGGNVVNFWAIAHYLGQQYPFFGLQAQGVDGKTKPFTDVVPMAEAYIKELRVLQPHGPYYLSGYCGGGWIAFEMAKQLRAVGEPVALLALLDCYCPSLKIPAPTMEHRLLGLRNEGLHYLWRKTMERVRRDAAETWCDFQIAYSRLLGKVVPYELRDFWLTKTLLRAAARYKPGVYDGKLTLLRAKDIDTPLQRVGVELGWSGLARGGIQVFDVPGDHHSLAHEPHVATLAARLRDCLEAAERTAYS
jgi:amino acid adenylation domain-containing protein